MDFTIYFIILSRARWLHSNTTDYTILMTRHAAHISASRYFNITMSKYIVSEFSTSLVTLCQASLWGARPHCMPSASYRASPMPAGRAQMHTQAHGMYEMHALRRRRHIFTRCRREARHALRIMRYHFCHFAIHASIFNAATPERRARLDGDGHDTYERRSADISMLLRADDYAEQNYYYFRRHLCASRQVRRFIACA